MDLNSLPDELIAGIFKYNTYETVHTIRKLNNRLNSIAKSYDYGTRIPVNNLSFYFGQRIRWKIKNGEKRIRRRKVCGEFKVDLSKKIWKYHQLGEYKYHGHAGFATRRPSAQQDVLKLFSRTQVREEAFICYSGVSLDDRLLEELTKQKNCFRNVKHIQLCMVKHDIFGVSKERMAQFFANCKKLRIFEFFTTAGMEIMANSEVFRCKKWTKLYLCRYSPGPTVDLTEADKSFLHNVVKNCTNIEIDNFNEMKMPLTVCEFLDFFEERLLEKNFFTKQHWRLPILKIGDLSVQNVCKRMEFIDKSDSFSMVGIPELNNHIRCHNMNLNSLPDELIAGIFKYNEFKTVHRIRKLDSRLNIVAKQYDFGTRIPVNRLCFSYRERIRWKTKNGEQRIRRKKVTGEFGVKLNKEMWNYFTKLGKYTRSGWAGCTIRGPSALQEIQKHLSAIQVREEVTIHFIGASLGDELLQELTKQKNCFRNVTQIRMCMRKHDVLGVSKEEMIRFFGKCKKLLIFQLFVPIGIENIVNSEIFRHRKWTEILLHRFSAGMMVDLHGTNKNFLYSVVKNCNKIYICDLVEVKSCSTVSEFLDFFEECMLEDDFFTRQKWRLPIMSIGNLTVRDVCKRLEIIENTDSFSLVDSPEFPNHIRCNIYLREKQVYISFSFEGRFGYIIHYENNTYSDFD